MLCTKWCETSVAAIPLSCISKQIGINTCAGTRQVVHTVTSLRSSLILKLTILSFRVTLTDAMRSMDVSCDSSLLTRTFPFPYHMLLARILVIPFSVSMCFLLYHFGLTTRLSCHIRFLLWLVNSSYNSLFLDC